MDGHKLHGWFENKFAALTGYPPFAWQKRLHQRLSRGEIPSAIDIPTGLGKTSVMAIWLLSRTMQDNLPRRLIYIVDRRAVVDQATCEAEKLRNALQSKEDLSDVRSRLGLNDDRPLIVSTLRGLFADNREWLSDPTLPAIIVGTIDMIGSRLLFEGYGVSRGMRPFHAGLLGADSLVVLDESHLCPPFEALLRSVAEDSHLHPLEGEPRQIIPKFQFLPLSATGRTDHLDAFRLEPQDCSVDDLVKKRLMAEKKLQVVRLGADADLVEHLVDFAWKIRGTNNRVLIFCDRRTDAEKVERALREQGKREKAVLDINLLVGARRIRERESLAFWLEKNGFLAGSQVKRANPAFLIATSAGEVGIDLDADHMTCDLVSFERMVQRLGRVNRRGEGAAIIMAVALAPKQPKQNAGAAQQQKYEEEKALYNARTGVLTNLPAIEDDLHDASPSAITELKTRASGDRLIEKNIRMATTPEPLRPALSRALIDAWSMTSLDQHTGRPDIGPWLRGWIDDTPQTVAAWRRFLPWRAGEYPDAKEVKAFFEAAPIHLTEILEAPTHEVRDTLIGRAITLSKEIKTDTPAATILNSAGEMIGAFTVGDLARMADKSAKSEKDALFSVLVGSVVVFSQALGGLSEAGLLNAKENVAPATLDDGWTEDEIEAIGYRVHGPDQDSPKDWLISCAFNMSRNEDDKGLQRVTVSALRRKDAPRQGDQAVSRVPQTVSDHHQWSGDAAGEIADTFNLPKEYRLMFITAARLHDTGKDRLIWQRAMNAPIDGGPYAKTAGGGDMRLLGGYRHELGSLGDAERDSELAKLHQNLRDLALHLIASHHGYTRPVVPPCDPDIPPSLLQKLTTDAALRFARLQRRWGPWGLAWWESVFRSVDWRASRQLESKSDEEAR